MKNAGLAMVKHEQMLFSLNANGIQWDNESMGEELSIIHTNEFILLSSNDVTGIMCHNHYIHQYSMFIYVVDSVSNIHMVVSVLIIFKIDKPLN